MRINKHDTNGTKPLLGKGELGYDDYTAGGDTGRVYVGNGASNIALAKKSEVDAKVVANAGITAGTYKSVTVDVKGLVTGGTNPTTLGGYGITDTYTKTETNTQISTAVANAIALGGRDVYLGSYGLTWNETTGVYTRIGAENYTAIQSKMKRCVLNADGSVNYYLSATNSNYKADGTAADLTGASGNVMVEIPKFYIRYGYTTTGGGGSDTVHSWEISQTPDTGFAEHWAFTRGTSVAKRYYPAYQGYSTGSKLISRSGVYPTVSQTLDQFRTLSKANSTTNPSTGQTVNGYWSNIDFALYEAITLLMIIEYGTMDIQSALGKGRTMLSGGSWVGSELIGATGLSNTFGNRTANYTYTGLSTDASADLSFMSYRGCENFFGNVWRMADGVIFLGTTNNKSMWFSTNPSTFNDTASGYTQVAGVSTASSFGYGRKLASTDKGFIITDVAGGTSGNGTTDYYHTSTADSTVALVGGVSDNGLSAGPLNLYVNYAAASSAAVNVGCGVSF